MPVNTPHADYTKFVDKWDRCRDVANGQDAVHAAGQKYLPKLKDQSSTSYAAMVMRATFYNATWRTIAGLVGMMFRRPVKIEVPASVKPLLDDIDSNGQPMQLFMQAVSENAITFGRVGVLVDYPQAPEGITQADAIRLNLRPSLQLYTAHAILNWRLGKVNNKTVLMQLVLKESNSSPVPGDEFATSVEDNWRVLDLVPGPTVAGQTEPSPMQYRQRLYRMKGGAARQKADVNSFEQIGADIFPRMNNKPLSYIPFVIMGTDDVSPDVDEPPLIDLVNMNLSHYRTTADYSHGAHFTGLPTLFLAGIKKENPDDKIYIGSEAAITTPNDKAQAKFIEFTGTGLGALEKKLEREEQQMAILGARMLEKQMRSVESAETASIHRKGEESVLSSMAVAISLGMTQAVRWLTEWVGADPAKVNVEINREFYPNPMTAQMLTALLLGWQQGAPGLSDQGLFSLLQAGEVVAPDVTLEDEQARIADRQQQIADQNTAAMLALAKGGGPGGSPDGGSADAGAGA